MLKQVILHIDISQFFVSVERLTHPEYNGKIVICGPDAPRSVVCSADYIARKEYGIKAGMPIWKVKQLLGQAVNNTIFTEVHFEEYQKYSFKFKNIIKQFGPVESFGLDECFVDVTKYLQNQSNFTELNEIEQREQAILVAEHIKALIKQQIQLDVSIGISDQKWLAKHNSDTLKNGITVVYKNEVQKIWDEPANNMLWVGPKTYSRLQELKINTIGDLARADGNLLKQVFGKNAEIMQIRAQGLDDGDFVDNTPWIAKSISHARTFPEDVPVNDTHQLLASLSEILAVLIEELRDKHAKCKTIELKIRNEKFVTITRSISVKDFTDDWATITWTVKKLFEEVKKFQKIRLLGVTLSKLVYQP